MCIGGPSLAGTMPSNTDMAPSVARDGTRISTMLIELTRWAEPAGDRAADLKVMWSLLGWRRGAAFRWARSYAGRCDMIIPMIGRDCSDNQCNENARSALRRGFVHRRFRNPQFRRGGGAAGHVAGHG